jgi:6-phosphogluconolactonase (cycloisomerase 2 family)
MRGRAGLNVGARPNAGNHPAAALFRNAMLSALVSVALAACGGGGVSTTDTSPSVAASQFSVGGTISGLTGSNLILENNNGDDLAIASSGSFTFPTTLIPGNSYNITVSTQPSGPAQTCVVSNGFGVISKSNVTSVAIICADKTTTTDSIGGTVTGLSGSGLVLQNDGGDDLAVASNGAFVFATPLASGMPYSVSVLTPPGNPNQDCVVANGSGNAAASDINNVTVTCTTNTGTAYTIGGTISGISGTSSIVLQDNGRDNLALSSDGAFAFATPVPSGSGYNVTSLRVSGQQSATCAFTNASGLVGTANVTNVTITCKANAVISATVSGLAGSGLILQDNGTDNLAITQNGVSAFATALSGGSTYSVSVATQPSNPTQTCTVSNGTGTAVPGSTTPVSVTCTTSTFTVGGPISGLTGSGLVLQDNGGNDLPVAAGSTTYVFPGAIISGGGYSVTILTQPSNPTQTCSIATGAGVIGGVNASVAVTCITNQFTVGGTVNGLLGAGLVLQDNSGNNLPVNTNGGFVFSTALSSGTNYQVTVLAQPTAPSQTCVVSNGAGPVTAEAVTDVAVTCTTNSFTVGGTVSGLAGTGLVLQDNGGNNLAITANGGFVFSAPLVSGSTYQVTVLTQPTTVSQTCVVNAGNGPIGNANVGSVAVVCQTDSFTVGGTVSGLAIGAAGGPVLQDNGGAGLATTNGPFTFPAQLSGTAYDVTVLTQPSGYFCAVGGAAGTVTNANVTNIAVTCTLIGAFLHVTNGGDATVTNFVIDELSGDLVVAGTVPTGLNPSSIVQGCGIGETFNSVFYVTNTGDNSVSAYVDDAFSGVLTPVPPPVPSGLAPVFIDSVGITDSCLAIALNGSGSSASVYTGSFATGALTAVAGSPFATDATPTAATHIFGANNNLEYIVSKGANEIALFTVDNTTGALSPQVSPATGTNTVATGLGPSAVDLQFIDVSGTATLFTYVTNQGANSVSIYSTDPSFGFLTELTDPPVTGTTPVQVAAGGGPTAMTIVNDENAAYYLYVANGTDGNLSGYSINVKPIFLGPCSFLPCLINTTAPGTPVPININAATGGATIATGSNPVAITQVSMIGTTYLYVVNQGSNSVSVFSVNMNTGALMEIAGSPFAAGTAPTSEAVQLLPDG